MQYSRKVSNIQDAKKIYKIVDAPWLYGEDDVKNNETEISFAIYERGKKRQRFFETTNMLVMFLLGLGTGSVMMYLIIG